MGLYGQEKCLYNEHCPNPYYLIKCNNPEIEKSIVEVASCAVCKKALLPEYNENDSLENLVACLEGEKKKRVKDYILKVLKGVV